MGAYNIFLDTETTGLSPKKHQVLTIGMIITDEKLRPVFEKEYLVRKESWSDVNPFALRINKINLDAHNIHAEPEKMICKKIIKDIKKYTGSETQNTATGHNLSFDFSFLGAMFERHEINFPFSFDFEDTMKMAKELCMRDKIKTNNVKLKTLCEYFGYTGEKFHNALEDVKATAYIYGKMKELLK